MPEINLGLVKGANGGYYTPAVSPSGLLSWTPSISTMPAVPDFDIVAAVIQAIPNGDEVSY